MQISFFNNPLAESSLLDLYNFKLVTDPNDIVAILDHLKTKDKIAFDIETTSLDWRKGTIHGMSLATDEREWYITDSAFVNIIPTLAEMSKNPKIMWIAHNAKFDIHFLDKYNFRPINLFDTLIAQALIDENQELKLKVLARTKLGLDGDLPDYNELIMSTKKLMGVKTKKSVSIWDIPIETLAVYAGKDARYTYNLGMLSMNELVKTGMEDLFYKVEMPFLYILLDMENVGFYIDMEALEQVEAELSQKQEEFARQWNELSGGVNPESPPQLQEYLYKVMKYPVTLRTEKGAPSTDYLALTRLVKLDKNGAVTALVNFRKYSKLMSTYVKKMKEETINGRLKSSFNQTGAVTWRLSSSDPVNFQNIPNKGDDGAKIRSLFRAAPGNKLVVIDYSQIELRLLAHYSKDSNMLQVFKDGGDPHQLTADLISSKGYNISRKQAKAVNFGWAYGMGPKGLANRIEQDTGERPNERDAKAWLNGFAEAYPATIDWKRRVLLFVKDHGYVLTLDGHKRRLPEIDSYSREVRARAERQAVNSIIQGSAAAVIKKAMMSIVSWQEFYGARMIAQVHDELIFEVKEEIAEEFLVASKREMESVEKTFNLRVSILADGHVGDNWTEAKG